MSDGDSKNSEKKLHERLRGLDLDEAAIQRLDRAGRDILESALNSAAVPAPDLRRDQAVEIKYRELRSRLEGLRLIEDIDVFRRDLEQLWKTHTDVLGEAAARLLVDLEHGRILNIPGAAHRRNHTPNERAFFAGHPLLDRDNVELLADGRVIAYLDKLQIFDSLSAFLRRVVVDALPPEALDGAASGKLDPVDAAMVIRILTHMRDLLVLGTKKESEQSGVSQRQGVREFRKVAGLNLVTAELEVLNMVRLDDIVRKIYAKMLPMRSRAADIAKVDNVRKEEWHDLLSAQPQPVAVPDFHGEADVVEAERTLFTLAMREKLSYLKDSVQSIIPYSENRGNLVIGGHVFGVDRGYLVSMDGHLMGEPLAMSDERFLQKLKEILAEF